MNTNLTQKQKAALKRAPPSQKAELRAMYSRQKQLASKTPRAKAKSRPQPQQQHKISVPRAPRLPQPVRTGFAFDGFDKRHMPLDETTAPYTTTNFISTLEFASSPDMDKIAVICPRLLETLPRLGPLTDYIAMLYDAGSTISNTMPTLATVRCPIVDAPTRATDNKHTSVRVRLHNMSVRLECLGTNTGLYPPGSAYIGTVPMIETGTFSHGSTDSLTAQTAWASDSIQTGYLRSIPASSLVEKPVQLDSAIAETVAYKTWLDVVVLSSETNVSKQSFSTALEPIVVYIPRCGAGDTAVNYRITIGQQWCSRHPHNVLLRSTQKQHQPTKPDIWHKAISTVQDVGGVLAKHAASGAMKALVSHLGAAQQPELLL